MSPKLAPWAFGHARASASAHGMSASASGQGISAASGQEEAPSGQTEEEVGSEYTYSCSDSEEEMEEGQTEPGERSFKDIVEMEASSIPAGVKAIDDEATGIARDDAHELFHTHDNRRDALFGCTGIFPVGEGAILKAKKTLMVSETCNIIDTKPPTQT